MPVVAQLTHTPIRSFFGLAAETVDPEICAKTWCKNKMAAVTRYELKGKFRPESPFLYLWYNQRITDEMFCFDSLQSCHIMDACTVMPSQ